MDQGLGTSVNMNKVDANLASVGPSSVMIPPQSLGDDILSLQVTPESVHRQCAPQSLGGIEGASEGIDLDIVENTSVHHATTGIGFSITDSVLPSGVNKDISVRAAAKSKDSGLVGVKAASGSRLHSLPVALKPGKPKPISGANRWLPLQVDAESLLDNRTKKRGHSTSPSQEDDPGSNTEYESWRRLSKAAKRLKGDSTPTSVPHSATVSTATADPDNQQWNPFPDRHTPSPDTFGASRTEGGYFRGRAQGDGVNMADTCKSYLLFLQLNTN
jgi:hypothetical protein